MVFFVIVVVWCYVVIGGKFEGLVVIFGVGDGGSEQW